MSLAGVGVRAWSDAKLGLGNGSGDGSGREPSEVQLEGEEPAVVGLELVAELERPRGEQVHADRTTPLLHCHCQSASSLVRLASHK